MTKEALMEDLVKRSASGGSSAGSSAVVGDAGSTVWTDVTNMEHLKLCKLLNRC